jgi:hypothetical protein
MRTLELLRQAFDLLGLLSRIQRKARKQLFDSLEKVASRCDDAYSKVQDGLVPVRNSYLDPAQLARALRAFTADPKIRSSVKPHKLCGDVSTLLGRLANNLDPLKYAVDVRRIRDLQIALGHVGIFDVRIKDEYEVFTRDLDAMANQLEKAAPREVQEWVARIQEVIADFDKELTELVNSIRSTKDRVLGAV